MKEETPTQKCGLRDAPKMRNSNLELYRIVVMFLIVIHHYVVNSGLTSADGPIYADPLSWRSIFLLLAGAWGKTGINCFVLITGYFMCKSNITLKKFAKLLGEVMFYRVIIASIFLLTGEMEFSLVEIAKLLIPIRVIDVGFTQAFLTFFLFVPFLNVLVQNMTQKQHTLLLALSGFLYVFLGTFPGFSVRMNYVSWFCVLYLISSYIRLYPTKLYDSAKIWAIAALFFVLISSVSVVSCAWLGAKLGRTGMAYTFVVDSNTLLAVCTGVSAFMFFKNLKIKQSRLINTVAASTFGVLCIHANSNVRSWLWLDFLKPVEHYGSAWMPLHAVGSSVLIFVVCTAIDYLRIRFVERPCLKLWDKWEPNLCEKLTAAAEKCKKILGKMLWKVSN